MLFLNIKTAKLLHFSLEKKIESGGKIFLKYKLGEISCYLIGLRENFYGENIPIEGKAYVGCSTQHYS